MPMPTAATTIEIIRRAERLEPLDDRTLRRRVATGEWVRITAGVFAPAAQWRDLLPLERHRTFVLEVARRMRRPAVLSFFAAAAIWTIDILGRWPPTVDVTLPRTSGGRSTGAVRRRTTDHAPETVAFGRHFLTTPAQTALDIARIAPFAHGVATVDQAIWQKRPGGALTTTDEIIQLLERGPHRGDARALRAISFANPLAANVRESHSRVLLARLGFPPPRLQERRVLRSGRVAYADFYFPTHDHWAEFDGRGKYLSPEFAQGRTPAEIVIDEKRRENEIRREVRGFSRWEPSDADDPRLLYRILTHDGLPSALPPP